MVIFSTARILSVDPIVRKKAGGVDGTARVSPRCVPSSVKVSYERVINISGKGPSVPEASALTHTNGSPGMRTGYCPTLSIWQRFIGWTVVDKQNSNG